MPRAHIDFTLNMTGKAEAILALLPRAFQGSSSDVPVEDMSVVIKTWPLYNGRERGYVLEVRLDASIKSWSMPEKECLLVSFSEHKRTDGAFVWTQTFEDRHFNDAPTIHDFTEESYQERTEDLSIEDAADLISVVICDYIQARIDAPIEEAV